ncbi:mutator type transposase [Tanacetum coccineum]
MVVHVGNSSTVDDVLELEMLFKTEGVGPVGKFKEVEVDAHNESEEESDIEGDYTSGSDSEDSYYDPKYDEVFDDDEHIVEDVHVSMNNFCFTTDPKHDISIGAVEVQEDDLDVIDYDSSSSELDDVIDSERRIQLRELRRIGKHKNKGPNKYYFYLGQQFASKERVARRVRMHSVETRRKLKCSRSDVETIDVGVSKMKDFRVKRIATDKMTGSPWPGQILTAVGVDANSEIYPISYAIVEAESKASWCWLLNILGEDLGLIQAIASVFPSAEHTYCVRHIHENMKSQFKGGVYKEMLWNATKATSIPAEQWSRAYFSGRAKCDLLLNNIYEVFNRQLVDGRDQPIITYLEYIREHLMKRIIVVQKVIAKTVGPLTPSMTKLFDAIKKGY